MQQHTCCCSKMTSDKHKFEDALVVVVEVCEADEEALHLVPGGQRYRYPCPGPRHCRKAEQKSFPF